MAVSYISAQMKTTEIVFTLLLATLPGTFVRLEYLRPHALCGDRSADPSAGKSRNNPTR
jgi:hypothetical protein